MKQMVKVLSLAFVIAATGCASNSEVDQVSSAASKAQSSAEAASAAAAKAQATADQALRAAQAAQASADQANEKIDRAFKKSMEK